MDQRPARAPLSNRWTVKEFDEAEERLRRMGRLTIAAYEYERCLRDELRIFATDSKD